MPSTSSVESPLFRKVLGTNYLSLDPLIILKYQLPFESTASASLPLTLLSSGCFGSTFSAGDQIAVKIYHHLEPDFLAILQRWTWGVEYYLDESIPVLKTVKSIMFYRGMLFMRLFLRQPDPEYTPDTLLRLIRQLLYLVCFVKKLIINYRLKLINSVKDNKKK